MSKKREAVSVERISEKGSCASASHRQEHSFGCENHTVPPLEPLCGEETRKAIDLERNCGFMRKVAGKQ